MQYVVLNKIDINQMVLYLLFIFQVMFFSTQNQWPLYAVLNSVNALRSMGSFTILWITEVQEWAQL